MMIIIITITVVVSNSVSQQRFGEKKYIQKRQKVVKYNSIINPEATLRPPRESPPFRGAPV